ncbi:unnamed protein product [Calypogeia fissa]
MSFDCSCDLAFYKVAGAVGVSSVEEAEAIKQEETQTIYGLGAGGNVPAAQQDTSSTGRQTDDGENSKAGKGGSPGDYGQLRPLGVKKGKETHLNQENR